MHGIQIDELFEKYIGGLGAWQIYLIFLTILSFSNNAILSVFFNAIPKHRCLLDAAVENRLINRNFTAVAHLIGPVDTTNNKFRQCALYNNILVNTSSILASGFNSSDSSISPCPYGYAYEYESEQYPYGIVQEWNLVCDKAWQVSANESAYMIGMMIGFIIGGWLSDRLGRRKIMLTCGCGEVIATIATALSPNQWVYILGRIAVGAFANARGSAYVVLISEITTANARTILFALGTTTLVVTQGVVMGLLVKYVRSWRIFMLICSSPALLFILHYWLLPESPRWLAASQNIAEARRILYSAYKFNMKFKRSSKSSVMTEEELFSKVGIESENEGLLQMYNALPNEDKGKSNYSVWNLFKPGMLRTTILSTLILTCQIMCSFGMLFFANNIKFHVYIVVIINSLVQIPGNILAALLYRYLSSRKRPLIGVYFAAILISSVTAFHTMYFKPPTDTAFNILANFLILLFTASHRMCFTYVPELYGPLYRNRGLGIAAGLARIAAMWYPQINDLDKSVVHGFPILVYALILVAQIVFLLFLDDTSGTATSSEGDLSSGESESSQLQKNGEVNPS